MLLSFDNERGLQPSRSNESRDGHSIASSSVDNNQSRTENQAGNFLTDDSEPDPYVRLLLPHHFVLLAD